MSLTASLSSQLPHEPAHTLPVLPKVLPDLVDELLLLHRSVSWSSMNSTPRLGTWTIRWYCMAICVRGSWNSLGLAELGFLDDLPINANDTFTYEPRENSLSNSMRIAIRTLSMTQRDDAVWGNNASELS